MVKVSFEFPTVEHALVAMGKLAGLTGAVKPDTPAKIASRKATQDAYLPAKELLADKPVAPAPSGATAPASVTGTRKPRNDAGKKRGAHKVKETGAVPDAVPPLAPAATGATAAQEGSAAPVSTSTEAAAGTDSAKAQADPSAQTAPAASVPSIEDCQKLTEKYHNKFGLAKALEWLTGFGVQRCRDLPEAKRAEFVRKTELEIK